MTARTWLLTLNNPDCDPREYLEKIHIGMKGRYTVGQLEKGEEGTPHIQFFMNFPAGIRISAFKTFDKRLHCEKVRRTPDTAADYCMKEETREAGPWEFGIRPVQRNSKHDWKEVLGHAKSGNIDSIPASIIV